MVCNKKVITEELGQLVISAIIVLISIHFAYDLAYNPACKPVLEFLQEKLLGVRLDSSRKTIIAYSNLYRAVGCIEEKFKDTARSGQDTARSGHDAHDSHDDETQAFYDF